MSCDPFRVNGNPVARSMLLNADFLALTSMHKRVFRANGNPVARPMLLNVGFLALTSMRKRQLRPMGSSARTAAMSCDPFRANSNPVA